MEKTLTDIKITMNSLENIEKALNDALSDQVLDFDTPVTITPVGLSPMVFYKQGITLSCQREKRTRQYTHRAILEGLLTLVPGTTLEIELIVASRSEHYWQLKSMPQSAMKARFSDILILIGNNDCERFFPATLLSFAEMEMTHYAVTFDYSSQKNTTVKTRWKPNGNQHWEIVPGILSLTDLSFAFDTSHYASATLHTASKLNMTVGGILTVGSVRLSTEIKMRLYKPWRLTFASDDVTLTHLGSLLFGGSKEPITTQFPKGLLSDDSDLVLSQVDIGLDIQKRAVTDVGFKLRQAGVWTLFNSIHLYNWTAQMNIAFDGGNSKIRGVIHGFIDLGTAAKLDVAIAIPSGGQGCTVQLKEGTTIELAGIGALMNALGMESSKAALPAHLTSFGSCSIDTLALTFDPTRAALYSFFFGMKSRHTWVVIPHFLEIKEVEVRVGILNKESHYQALGSISGKIHIGRCSFGVKASKLNADDPWLLKMNTTVQPLHIPGFEEAATWLMPATVVQRIPSAVMPFGKGFDLTVMELEFNLSTSQLEALSFRIVNSAPWVIVEKYLVLDRAFVDARITDCNTDRKMALSLGAQLTVAAAVIDLKATYDSSKPWKLVAALSKPICFSLDDLLKKLSLHTEFPIPQDLGLPTLTVNKLEGWAIPEQKEFSFTGDLTLTSAEPATIQALGLQFRMLHLTAAVQVKNLKEDPQKSNYRRVALGCTLDMQTLQIAATLQFGSAKIDTVFRGSILSSDFSIASLADSLSTHKWDEITPTDTAKVGYQTGVIACLNLTQDEMALCGKLDGLGSAFFLAQYTDAAKSERGYVFTFTLDQKFRFANLFTTLAPIDELIAIRRASIVVSSYAARTDQTKLSINNLIAYENNPLELTNPIDETILSTTQIEKGVHLYAQIEFKGWINAILRQLSEKPDEELAAMLTLYAFMDTDSSKTKFKATLPILSLFAGIVTLKGKHTEQGVMLQYSKGQGCEFLMEGILALRVFEKNYDFECTLSVNELRAEFGAVLQGTECSIPMFQEQLPATFALKEFALGGTYLFQTPTDEKHLELQLTGSVKLASIDLTAALYLIDSKPVLVYVSLNQNLSLSCLVEDVVGEGFHWPNNLLDITFRKDTPEQRSLIYYYDQANDRVQKPITLNGRGFTEGYNLQATVDLTLLTTISFELHINFIKGHGLTASASLLHPIDLFIIQLAGTQKAGDSYSGGPSIFIRTDSNGQASYGLSTGINFCGTALGTAEVVLGKDKNNETAIAVQLQSTHVPVFGELALGFSYSKAAGFKIENIPNFDFLYELEDLGKKIKDILRAKSCSADPCTILSDFVNNVLYKNNYKFTPELTEVEGKGHSLVLNGKFQLLTMMDIEVCSLDFKNVIVIPLNSVAGLSGLSELIRKAIGEVVTSFLESLLSNKEQLALLLSIFFGEQALSIATEMLCRGLTSSSTVTATSAAASSAASASASASVSAASAATAAATAAGASAASASAAGTTAAAAATAAGAGFTFLFMSNTKKQVKKDIEEEKKPAPGPDPEPEPEPDPKPGPPPTPTPETPQFQSDALIYQNQTLKAQWKGAAYAAGYEVEFSDPSGQLLGETISVKSNQLSVVSNPLNPDAFNGGAYSVRVRSTHNPNVSDWITTPIKKLATPTDLSYRIADQQTEVSWNHTSQHSTYVVSMRETGKEPLAATVETAHHTFDRVPQAETRFEVKAISAIPGKEVDSATVVKQVRHMDEPQDVRLIIKGGLLHLEWEKDISDNRGYNVTINGGKSPKQVTLPAHTTFYTIPADTFDEQGDNGPFSVIVSTIGEIKSLDSVPSKPSGTIVRLKAPRLTALQWNYQESSLLLTIEKWPDESSCHYFVEIVDNNTQKIVLAKEISSSNTRFELADFSTPPVGVYRCDIRALSTTNEYESLKIKGSILEEIAPVNPVITSFEKQGNEVVVKWNDCQPANQTYFLEVVNQAASTTAVIAQSDIQYHGKKATIHLDKFTTSGSYSARVRLHKIEDQQVLQNGDGAEGFNFWTLEGDTKQWFIEHGIAAPCTGSDDNSCFATLHSGNRKWQQVNIQQLGHLATQLNVSFSIEVTDWIYSSNPAIYRLIVKLLSEEGNVIAEFDSQNIEPPCGTWKKITHQFTEFGAGVRSIYFEHSGVDIEKWYIPYGCKMTGARIRVSLVEAGPWSEYFPIGEYYVPNKTER